jgi:putative toxin-antitoxin system antitoxin component (TIGR02293 family)
MNAGSTDSSPSDNREIERQVQDVFGDVVVAREWLLAPNPALAHQTPTEALRTVSGARAVEAVLTRIEHGVYE